MAKNWRRKYLFALACAMRMLPNPGATEKTLEAAIRMKIMALSDDEYSPRLPRDDMEVLGVFLGCSGISRKQTLAVMKTAYAASATNPEASKDMATIDEIASAPEYEDVLNNLGDVVESVLTLDLGGAIEEGIDTIADFGTDVANFFAGFFG